MKKLGRPPVKKRHVQDTLREGIVSGEIALGARLPTRRELAAQYDATLHSVQGALSNLETDGFVVSRGKLGTFVVDHPPHLNHVALVFSENEGSSTWGLYWDHLAAVARQVVKEQGLRLSIYTGVNKRFPGADYARLVDDLQNNRLAGIIFSDTPFPVEGTAILDKPAIPRVALMEKDADFPQVAKVNFDHAAYTAKAVNRLQEKNIASVGLLQYCATDQDPFVKAFEKAGIYCPYHYQHGISLSYPHWARNCMRLLFGADKSARPEALLVLDDNLFAPALAGIMDAGLTIPEDLEIITHSNFPWQEVCPAPVSRLGYDMRALLHVFIAELDRQREGNPPQEHTLTAVFEEELPADYPSYARKES